jgi:hypothetical protein
MSTEDVPTENCAAPVDIEVVIDGQPRRLRYDKAFVLACALLEDGQVLEAARLFERMEEFVDRGPRAFIMQAFCEAAALHLDKCGKPLAKAFDEEDKQLAEALQGAFVSYHVGIRQDAIKTMAELVNKHHNLPTLCLLLGDMLKAADNLPMARKCWSLAIHRDRTGGAVAAAAERQLRRFGSDSASPQTDA